MIAAIKTLLFALAGPGMILFYLPWRIVRAQSPHPPPPLPFRIAAILFWVLGAGLAAWTIWDFARKGRGTPAPLVPTQALVASGPYRFSRNPMYVGVLLILLGHTWWTRRWPLLLYTGAVASLFHSVVVLYEEPHLHQQFGEAYATYQRQVPRWLSRRGIETC